MKRANDNNIENITLSAKQIKAKLEDSLAYDHDKFRNINILFTSKASQSQKLPFSDFKVSVSEELYGQQLLIEDIKKHIESIKMLEDKEEVELTIEEPEIVEEVIEEPEDDRPIAPKMIEEVHNDVNIIEEICEFDEIEEDDEEEFEDDEEEEKQYAQLPYSPRAKRPKGYTIKVVDVKAVIKKIKDEAIAKNAGKPVMSRRQINKLLKPYILKNNNNMDIDGIDTSLTSIDIYLNAVDKIAHTNDVPVNKNSNNSLELNLNDILDDLDK